MFSSHFVKSLLDYKMLRSKKVTYAFMGSYMVYLCSLMTIKSRIVVGFWFMLHLTEEVLQFKQTNGHKNKYYTIKHFHKLLLNHFGSIWNYFDISRLFCMIGFMYTGNTIFYSWLMMISFLSSLKFLRAFPSYRIFIQLLIACI